MKSSTTQTKSEGIRRGKAGPSGPVAGLLADVQAAEPPDNPAALLTDLRSGGHSQPVIDAYRYLIYQAARDDRYAESDPRGYRDWLLGPLWLALCTAVDRLSRNTAEPEPYIRDELRRARRDLNREQSIHIRPPDSTNSDRRKGGKTPHPTLRRRKRIERRGEWIDPLNDYETLKRAGYATNSAELSEDIIVPETPLEKMLIGLILAGLSEREAAASLRITRHQVRRIINILRLRANRAA